MGNYKDLHIEFIERTMELISQYEGIKHQYPFEQQFNHTLLINCLLGLIVFPKEQILSYLPKHCIADRSQREEMGLFSSTFNSDITNFKDLVISLRNSIAHFHISFHSNDDQFLIDRIVFSDPKRGDAYVVATFFSDELLSFVRYYSCWLLTNLRNNRV